VSPEKGWWNELVRVFSVAERVILFQIPTGGDGFGIYWVSVVELLVKDYWENLR